MALSLLIGLQFVLAWLAARSERVEGVIKSEPTLLFFRGKFPHHALLKENVTPAGVRAQIRQQGVADISTVHAVVLEADGSMNVIVDGASSASALEDVAGHPPEQSAARRGQGGPNEGVPASTIKMRVHVLFESVAARHAVTEHGTPRLTRYARVIVNVAE